MAKDLSYYVKTGFLAVLLFGESYVLTDLISDHILAQNYFGFSLVYSLKVVGLMLAILYTFALTVGAWNKWEQYVIVPIPIVLATFSALVKYNLSYALLVSLLFCLILIYDIHKSSILNNIMTQFHPKMILRLSSKGVLLIFTILGAMLVILSSTYSPQSFNIGKKVADVIKDPVKRAVDKQLQKQIQDQSLYLQNSEQELDLTEVDPALQPLVESLNLEEMLGEGSPVLPDLEVDVGRIVENQVNSFIAPYKNFVMPIMAVLMFALFQFYAAISYFLFVLTVDILFWFVRKTGFMKVEHLQVIQERLHF